MQTLLRRLANYILDCMFACDHKDKSWPRTTDGRTYRSYIICGHKTEYSMVDMCDVTPSYLRWKSELPAFLKGRGF